MDDSETRKREAARAALEYVRPGQSLGIGAGSTVSHFIELLDVEFEGALPALVSSSKESTRLLEARGMRVVDLNQAPELSVYVDGADEFEPGLSLLKGGGGALTGEKIVAAAAATFVCIVDQSKRVETLGGFPLPIEVLPMAREPVARKLRRLGGEPRQRDLITDHGNLILDTAGLQIGDPLALELELETTPGVVCCGLFARRGADVVLMATSSGIERFAR